MTHVKLLENELILNLENINKERRANELYKLLIQRSNLKDMLLEAYRKELSEKECNLPRRLAS